MPRRSLRVPPLAALAILLPALLLNTAGFFSTRGMERPEQWLVDSTVVVMQAPDVAKTREAWSRTAAGKAWADPAVAYWRDVQMVPAIEDVLTSLGARSLPEILSLVTGEACLALDIPEPAVAEGQIRLAGVSVFAMADFGDNAAAARERIRAQWQAVGRQWVTAGGRKAEIVLHTEPQGHGLALASAWVDDTCILATSPQALEGLLKRRLARESTGSLGKTPAWRAAAKQRVAEADITTFANAARLYGLWSRTMKQLLTNQGRAGDWPRLEAIAKTLGVDRLDLLVSSVRVRGEGFYSRSAVTTRGEPGGLMFLTDPSKPLKTPGWMTGKVNAFSATRIRPLGEIRRTIFDFVKTVLPEYDLPLQNFETRFKEIAGGLSLQTLLSALGPEVAFLEMPSISVMKPRSVLLWEIGDETALEQVLNTARTWPGIQSTRNSFMGYHTEVFRYGTLPLALSVGKIGGFLMISSTDQWLRDFVSLRKQLASGAIETDEAHPAGLGSLLPLLEAPFEPPARGLTVVGRSYSDPKPSLIQINGLLPLALPLINSQLSRYGQPRLPSWARPSLPPLLAFARHSFPTVGRTTQGPGLLIEESYSSFEPLTSPFAAGLAVMACRYYDEHRN